MFKCDVVIIFHADAKENTKNTMLCVYVLCIMLKCDVTIIFHVYVCVFNMRFERKTSSCSSVT